MSYYSNPTANAAIGAVDKELNKVKKEVKRLKELKKEEKLTEERIKKSRSRFKEPLSRRVFDNMMARIDDEEETEEE